GRPTITVGSVGLDDVSREAAKPRDLSDLLERLAAEEFDMVAVGRALLADPAWANKIRDGRQDEVTGYTQKALASLT
ncbi:MAG: 12-oxophytodienoate reductase, partial [Alphaproteobacteria bacterium]|nr:12-oxophytodienoate reductase [Alphaproteobacteria bacterium]